MIRDILTVAFGIAMSSFLIGCALGFGLVGIHVVWSCFYGPAF